MSCHAVAKTHVSSTSGEKEKMFRRTFKRNVGRMGGRKEGSGEMADEALKTQFNFH